MGIDNVLNQKKNAKIAHFSLFECIENYEVAKLLLDTSVNWLKERDIDIIRGPVSPMGTDDDEYIGLLTDCFRKTLRSDKTPCSYIQPLILCGFPGL